MLNDFSIEVIWDKDKALRLAAGRVSLLRTILSVFPRMAKSKLQELEDAFDDRVKFAASVHSIQGAASQIAAERAHKMGLYIEIEAREGDFAKAQKLLPIYKATVEETISNIDQWLGATHEDTRAAPVTDSRLVEDCDYPEIHELIKMLSAGKASAIKGFQKTRPLLEKTVSEAQMHELRHLIVSLEFEKAAELLREHFSPGTGS